MKNLHLQALVLKGGFKAELNILSHHTGLFYLKEKFNRTNISLLLDSRATDSFVITSCAKHMKLKVETIKEPIKVMFAQKSSWATQIIGLNFDVGNTKFIEDYIVCDFSNVDFVLDNTFLNSCGVEIRRRPRQEVVIVRTKEKLEVLNDTCEPSLDHLEIQLVSQG